MPVLKLAVLVSGRGTNLRALLEAIDAGRCRAGIAAVVSDRSDAAALEHAAQRGIATRVVSPKAYSDRAQWDEALAAALAEVAPDLIVLAGFMRLVGERVLARFPRRLINVHPALLPAFPGLDAAGQAVRAGARISGCTVHLVDAGMDTGPILAQAAVPVLQGDDGPSLHARIQACEHALLPAVVDAIAAGSYLLDPEPRYLGEGVRAFAPLISPAVIPC